MIVNTHLKFFFKEFNIKLKNCHTNSSLQALFATEEFRNYVIKEKIDGPLVCEVSKLFKAMASSETEIKLSPNDLRSKFVPLKPQFEGSDQLFAQEFLKFIIDLMHEEVNKATKTNDPKPDPLHTQNLGPILF